MDFHDALNIAIGETTPQPWDYTTPDGTTLTAIPAGLRADEGDAEVMIRITADKTLAAEIGITTAELPGLIGALGERRAWDRATVLDSLITVTHVRDAGTVVVITETGWEDDGSHYETSTSVRLPDVQRMPFASALRRALDVARGWEG